MGKPMRTVISVSIAIASTAAWAAPRLPPEPLVIAALDNHPSVIAAAARVDAARAGSTMLARGTHELTLQGSYVSRDVTNERRYDEFDSTLMRGVRLPGKARLDRKAGELGVDVAHNRMEDARHQVALMLAGLWFDWQVAGELRRNEQSSVDLLQQELRALERRRDLRDAAQLDVDQAQAALDQARGQAAQSAALEAQARARLAAMFPDLPLPDFPPDLGSPELPEQSLEALRDMVVSRSHEIVAAEREAERLGVLSQRATRDRVADPSLGVRLFSERSGMERGAGVVFQMPLGGGYRKAVAAQASAEANAASFDLANVRREVEATADADLADVRSRMETWGRFASAVRSAGQAAERTATGHRLGELDLAALLLARRQHNDARRMEIATRADAIRALVRLQIDAHVIWQDEDVDH